jgi:tetratricopeptide (TPR) repeat protein
MTPGSIAHASALYQAGDIDGAQAICARLIAANGADARALLLSGIIAERQGRRSQALDLLRRAVAAAPGEPVAGKRLAMTLHADGRTEEALAVLRDAAEQAHGSGRQQDAQRLQADFMALLERRAALQARLDRSYELLREGRYEEGWADHEARLERLDFRYLTDTPVPRWRGEPLAGKSILVRGEQGHGDHLQFFRYVPKLVAMGAAVSVETWPGLERLFAANTPARVFTRTDTPPMGYDWYCPIMSLPLAFGTRLDSIPAEPYLAADPLLARRWHQRLPPGPLRVGLVWAGGQQPHHAALAAVDGRRSLDFAHFEPLLDTPGAVFCSLQLGNPAEQAAAAIGAGRLQDWTAELGDFADTAALVDALDLVISADTAPAHLAAAMNKPTWILSRHDGCWRWLQDRDDTPWYASARLFRQTQPGDWDEVMQRVRQALAALAAERAGASRAC